MQIKICDPRLGTLWPLPEYGTDGAAAVDLRAMLNDELILYPGQTALVKSGFALNMQDKNMAALIIPRSGLGFKNGIVLGHSTGLIDSDYLGEIQIGLLNRTSNIEIIKPGERVAQMFFVPILHPSFDIVAEFDENTGRGSGGFGHTGRT